MELPWKFRRATEKDLSKINTLVNSAYRGDSSREGWTTEADFLVGQRTDVEHLFQVIGAPNSFLYVVQVDEDTNLGNQLLRKDEIIANVELRIEAEGCYLGMLTVKPTLQNSGLGRWILEQSEKMAKEWKLNKMFMTVITIRHELIDWYERRGYRRTGKTRGFHVDPAFGIPNRHLEMEVLEKNL